MISACADPLDLLIEQERRERMEAGVAAALMRLSDRERLILSCRFRLDARENPATLKECARILKISPGRAWMLAERALYRLQFRARDVAVEALGLIRCPACARHVSALRFDQSQDRAVCTYCFKKS